MTDEEKKEIVSLVISEIESRGIKVEETDEATDTSAVQTLLGVNADEAMVRIAVDKVGATAEQVTQIETNRANIEKLATAVAENTEDLQSKQDVLVSGVNIKSINGNSILGKGEITITGSGDDIDLNNYYTKQEVNVKFDDLYDSTISSIDEDITELITAVGNKQDTLVSGKTIKTINGESLLGGGNITIESGETVENITWTDTFNLNDYYEVGIYNITGVRKGYNDNMPITNVGDNASISARLIVTVTPEGATTYRHIIGQTLILSNAQGFETKVYTRSAFRTSYDGGVTYEIAEWTAWKELQSNQNVGVLESLNDLNDFTDNGIYSGVISLGTETETFVMIVINDYALGVSPRRVSQFRYSLIKASGAVNYLSRSGYGDDAITWGEWDITNKDVIDAALKEKQDSLDGKTILTINDTPLALGGSITIEGGSGGGITVDTALDEDSENPVQNKVVTENINLVYNALKTLYESAGAIYNDTDTDIDRTVKIPSDTTYGDEQDFVLFEYDDKGNLVLDEEGNPIKVKHKAGHWFLNGIGDITWEEMAKIYTQGKWFINDVVTGGMSGKIGGRTNLPPLYYSETYYKTFTMRASFNDSKMLVAWLGYYENLNKPTHSGHKLSITDMKFFGQSSAIKRVVGLINAEKWTVAPDFPGTKLEYITIINLKRNVVFKYATNLSKESIIYMIANSAATSAITITLHANVYAKCIEGGEWYDDVENEDGTITTGIKTALSSKEFVSIVSA